MFYWPHVGSRETPSLLWIFRRPTTNRQSDSPTLATESPADRFWRARQPDIRLGHDSTVTQIPTRGIDYIQGPNWMERCASGAGVLVLIAIPCTAAIGTSSTAARKTAWMRSWRRTRTNLGIGSTETGESRPESAKLRIRAHEMQAKKSPVRCAFLGVSSTVSTLRNDSVTPGLRHRGASFLRCVFDASAEPSAFSLLSSPSSVQDSPCEVFPGDPCPWFWSLISHLQRFLSVSHQPARPVEMKRAKRAVACSPSIVAIDNATCMTRP